MKTTRVELPSGFEDWRVLYEKNGLGVTKNDALGTYTVTHLKTGRRVKDAFYDRKSAKGFLTAIAELAPWESLTLETLSTVTPEMRKKIRAEHDLWQANDNADEVDHL